jgi:hypothetical protein
MMMGMVSFPLHNEDHISAAYFLSDAMAVGAHSDRVYIERRSARLWGQKMNVMVAVACMPSAAMVPSRSCSVFRRDVVFDRYKGDTRVPADNGQLFLAGMGRDLVLH